MKISTIDDVQEFFRYLTEDRKVNLHPDNPFSDYINIETKEPSFTKEECEEYDAAMLRCFEVCEEAGVDIYEIGLDLLIGRLQQNEV